MDAPVGGRKTGTSTWTLTGSGTATTGWDVQAGTLLVNGSSFGGAFVRSGATLGASYTGQLAQDTQDHAFKANLAVRF